MKHLKIALALVCSFFIMTSCGEEFENGNKDKFAALPDSPATVDEDENKVYTFNHPCLMHTDADFEFVANKIQQQAQPWTDAWTYLKSLKYTKLDDSFTNSAPDHLERNPYQQGQSEGNFKVAREPGLAAYYLGLCWRIAKKLGEANADLYAEKAVKIMDNWTSTCKYLKVEDTHDHYALVLGFDGHRFVQATELLRDYQPWVENGGFDKAKTWLKTMFAEPAKYFMSFKTDPYYSWGGWEVPSLNSLLSIGIVCEDQEMINYAVNFFKHGPSSGCIGNLVVALHQDPAGLGQGYCLGQADESGRDQDHAGLSMATLAPMCQAAYNIGEDLYVVKANSQYKDKNGDLHDRYPKYSEYGDANLTLAFFEYYAKYNADKYQTAEMPFTNWTTRNGEQTQIASSGRGHFYAGYEMVYNHYKNVLHVDAPYCKQFAEKYRPATSEHPYEFDDDFPGIGTLMFYRGE